MQHIWSDVDQCERDWASQNGNYTSREYTVDLSLIISVTAVESIAGTSFKIIKIPVPGLNNFCAAPVARTLDTAFLKIADRRYACFWDCPRGY